MPAYQEWVDSCEPSEQREPGGTRVHAPGVQVLHGWCDKATEVLLWGIMIFSPWAFGTTQPWSIAIVNAAGITLGLLFFSKLLLRKTSGWSPERWSHVSRPWITKTMAALSGVVLIYCLISALNARATFTEESASFVYRDSIAWLPHSYDSGATWAFLLRWVALALVFWSMRDFLATKAPGESKRSGLPSRVQRVLWVISVNGAVLALEGLIQRMLGSSELLWLVEPSINKSPEAQFGPYAYRSNASQYFLMAWPLALGLWHGLRKSQRPGRFAVHNYLLVCILVMAMVPFFALSRAGAIIGAVVLLGSSALMFVKGRQFRDRARIAVAFILFGGVVLGGLVEWDTLSKRFLSQRLDSGRIEIWRNTWEIFKDYPVFGTGPGTFGSVYHLYRPSVQDGWAAHAHNDWLELLMTFGLMGALPVLAGGGLLLVWPWATKKSGGSLGTFRACIYLSLGSCVAYASVDMPFKVYSVTLLFVLVAALASLGATAGRMETTKPLS